MQQVFLSYTYNPHPDFTADGADLLRRVSTVIESMDLRIVTGEDLAGQGLTPAVQDRIARADALVALLMPWKDSAGNQVAPPWVIDEFAYARGLGKRSIRVLHPTVVAAGMFAAHEYIAFEPGNVADVLLKLMKTLALWKRESGRPMEIEIALDAAGRPFDPNNVRCEFQLFRNYEESNWLPAKIWPQPGALYAYLPGVPDQAKLRLRLQRDTELWQSDYTSPVGRVQLSRR